MKVDQARDELAHLDDFFRERILARAPFCVQMMKAGFDCEKCILVRFFPDSGSTYVGRIIRQDGRVFDFDIDEDSSDFTTWRDVTEEVAKKLRTGQLKPWSEERVAYDAFYALNGVR